MYQSSCQDQAISPGQVIGAFDCLSYKGQSGSPVWLYHSDTDEREIRGVQSSSDSQSSYFTLLAKAVFDELDSAINNWPGPSA